MSSVAIKEHMPINSKGEKVLKTSNNINFTINFQKGRLFSLIVVCESLKRGDYDLI